MCRTDARTHILTPWAPVGAKNYGMQNVYYTFRKKKARQAAKEHRERHKEYVNALEKRNAVLEHQNEALKAQIKKLKQFYEQDLLNSN